MNIEDDGSSDVDANPYAAEIWMAKKLAALGVSSQEFLDATAELLELGLLERNDNGAVRISEFGLVAIDAGVI